MTRLHGLDALRGIAAALVVVGHIKMFTRSDWPLANFGVSVDFFFMLSGYVMARTYEARMRAGLGPVGFLRIRVRRLWPVAAVGTLIGFAYVAATAGVSVQSFVALAFVLCFLPFPGGGWMFPFNGVIWSLFAELLANLFHALLLARLPSRWLLVLLAVAASGFFGTVVVFDRWPVAGWPAQLAPSLLRVMTAYLSGVLLYRRFGDERIGFVPLPLLLPVIPAFVIGTAYYRIGLIDDLFFVFVVSPLLILAAAGCRPAGWQARWAAASGALSYPLYAVHEPLLKILFAMNADALSALALAAGAIGAAVWFLARPREAKPAALRA